MKEFGVGYFLWIGVAALAISLWVCMALPGGLKFSFDGRMHCISLGRSCTP